MGLSLRPNVRRGEAEAMDLAMRGLTALVTGAAGGIGRAVAERLAAEGVRVALADRDVTAVTEAATVLVAAGADASAHEMDVTDEVHAAAAINEVVERYSGIDLLVLCAGVSGPVGTSLVKTSRADWDAVFAVNVTGVFLVLKHALTTLRASDAASVVVVASDSALVAAPGMAPYCASKGALVQFARAAAVELAPDGVRINAVCPSIVDTPMSRRDLGLENGFRDIGYPVLTPAEVAVQVAFLCSPLSRPVNAAALVADFGFSARSGFPA